MTMLTIVEAALVVNRKKSTIYEWIKQGRLIADVGLDGVKRVDGRKLMQVESSIKRGRPHGSASFSTRRTNW